MNSTIIVEKVNLEVNNLEEKRFAVITGGSSGIGLATAKKCWKET